MLEGTNMRDVQPRYAS